MGECSTMALVDGDVSSDVGMQSHQIRDALPYHTGPGAGAYSLALWVDRAESIDCAEPSVRKV
jgi:hypothetical protein